MLLTVPAGAELQTAPSGPAAGKCEERTAGAGGAVWSTVRVHQPPPESRGALPADPEPSQSVVRESQ
jgi:hypothetical protein